MIMTTSMAIGQEEDINPIVSEDDTVEVGAGATPAATEGACEPYELRLATSPVPPQSPTRLKTFDRDLARIPKTAKVVAFGDSQVGTWPQEQFSATFDGKRTVNLGLNGDYVQNALWRLQDPRMASIDPSLVIVIIGGANLSQYSGCAIAAGTIQMLDRIRETWPNAYILRIDITPRGSDFTQRDDRRIEANALVRAHMANMPNTGVVNFDSVLTCDQYLKPQPWYFSIQQMFSGGGSPCENYRDDMTHLTKVGYDVFGRELLNALAQLNVEY